jgi:hypothetical protein
MGHAPRAVLRAAEAATVENQHDGAALAIERYVLGYEVHGREHDEYGANAGEAAESEVSATGASYTSAP